MSTFKDSGEYNNLEEMAEAVARKIIISNLQKRLTQPAEVAKRRRVIKDTEKDFWESNWGKLLRHPDIHNPRSVEGKRFRRRFRLPFPLFEYFVDICIRYNIFDMTNKSPIPIQLKIMACLRILARDNCADDINELSFQLLGESTVHNLFKTFVTNVSIRIFPKVVKLSKGKELEAVLHSFAKVGLPGCVGSMDCTRVKWTMCPARQRWGHVGKEGFPTVVFLVIVDHNKRVQYVSGYYKGSCNDIQICQNDPICLAVLNGALEDVEYELYNEFGELYKCKGGYILVDGGFINSIVFIEPEKFRLDRDSVLFSEWLESVRKDVECFFGILKKRWWWFRNGICYHDSNTLEAAFKSVCALNNMILAFDKGTGKFDHGWENIDWGTLDPDADDAFDLDPTTEIVELEDIIVRNNADDTDNFANSITQFTCKMPKTLLKEALKKSFVIQWIKQKLQWPKNIANSQRSHMPMVRATIEMKRALYKAPSVHVTISKKSINYGLFSKLGYRKDDLITEFKGKLRSIKEWNEICETQPQRRAYGIQSSEYGNILDCYDHYKDGLCIASASNSSTGLKHKITGILAQPNCRLVVPIVKRGERKRFYLRAGPLDCLPNFFIQPHTELLWDYGDDYEY